MLKLCPCQSRRLLALRLCAYLHSTIVREALGSQRGTCGSKWSWIRRTRWPFQGLLRGPGGLESLVGNGRYCLGARAAYSSQSQRLPVSTFLPSSTIMTHDCSCPRRRPRSRTVLQLALSRVLLKCRSLC